MSLEEMKETHRNFYLSVAYLFNNIMAMSWKYRIISDIIAYEKALQKSSNTFHIIS